MESISPLCVRSADRVIRLDVGAAPLSEYIPRRRRKLQNPPPPNLHYHHLPDRMRLTTAPTGLYSAGLAFAQTSIFTLRNQCSEDVYIVYTNTFQQGIQATVDDGEEYQAVLTGEGQLESAPTYAHIAFADLSADDRL